MDKKDLIVCSMMAFVSLSEARADSRLVSKDSMAEMSISLSLEVDVFIAFT